jgi:hypothetical protein
MSPKHHPFHSGLSKIVAILILGIALASLTPAGLPQVTSGSFVYHFHPPKDLVDALFNECISHSLVDVPNVSGAGGLSFEPDIPREAESWQWPPSSRIERACFVDLVINENRSSLDTSLDLYNIIRSQIFQLDLSLPLIADGQFVWGPNVGDFEIRGYLEGIGSALAAYSDDIEIWARYATVNPMVMLTMLELQYGYVKSLTDDLTPEEIRDTIENTSMDLAIAFYEHLHTWGTRRPPEGLKDSNPVIVFTDGSTAQISPDHSSGSFAIAATLAESTDVTTWLEQVSFQSSEGFTSVFGSLFPEIDLLDNSNDINPPTLPAADLFQFPFPLGATWYFNGPHSWAGDDTPPFSSMDFYTGGGTCDSPPNTYTVAAQTGTAIRPYGYDCWLEIDHGDGWTTSYYHLQNMIDPQGGTVNQNSSLGKIACEVCAGGWASGPHVHWSLKYNGAYVSLEGVRASGWTIHVGPEPYDTGYIERDGQTLNPFGSVINDYHLYYPRENTSLRFQGNGENDIDRVKIPINDPPRPADLGSSDFTIEWWMKSIPGENNTGSCTPGGENWASGNHILDRSVHDEDGSGEYGVSLADGRIAFGINNGTESDTLCGVTDVADGDWHHVAITRGLDGSMRIFIDGTLDAETSGPSGGISYPDDHVETHPNDPYLVIGAEKFDLDLILYPSFSGWIDEIHASNILRYVEDFTPSTEPVFPDGSSVALYHFDEGTGDFINDTSGSWSGPSNGTMFFGGDPAGPEWSTDTPFNNGQISSGYEPLTDDYDGDGISDIGYFKAGAPGLWGILTSSHNFDYFNVQWFSWGQDRDTHVSGDYDGDEMADPSIRRPPAEGQSSALLILLSSTGYDYDSYMIIPAGWPSLGDVLVPADYDGDGRTDPAIYRASLGVWIIPLSTSGYTNYQFASWGSSDDIAIGADMDGDGKADIGYYQPLTGIWGFLKSTEGYSYSMAEWFNWGGSNNQPITADYDGDGITDPAFITPPADGQSAAYRILLSGTGFDYNQALTIPSGWPSLGDTPVPADYDGDGRADPGIWRSSNGVWIIPKSSCNYTCYLFSHWGTLSE